VLVNCRAGFSSGTWWPGGAVAIWLGASRSICLGAWASKLWPLPGLLTVGAAGVVPDLTLGVPWGGGEVGNHVGGALACLRWLAVPGGAAAPDSAVIAGECAVVAL
jgi:hypothetical protein